MSEEKLLEVSIEEAKKMVDLRDQALRLTDNREFRNVILNGYLKEEAIRLSEISAMSQLKDSRDEIFLEIQGISLFHQYMRQVISRGDVAEQEIREQYETLDELRAGEEVA